MHRSVVFGPRGPHGLRWSKHVVLWSGSESTRFQWQPLVPGFGELQPTGWWSSQQADFLHQQPGPFAQCQVGRTEFGSVPHNPRQYHRTISCLCWLRWQFLLQIRDCLVLWWRRLSVQPICQEHVFSSSMDSRMKKVKTFCLTFVWPWWVQYVKLRSVVCFGSLQYTATAKELCSDWRRLPWEWDRFPTGNNFGPSQTIFESFGFWQLLGVFLIFAPVSGRLPNSSSWKHRATVQFEQPGNGRSAAGPNFDNFDPAPVEIERIKGLQERIKIDSDNLASLHIYHIFTSFVIFWNSLISYYNFIKLSALKHSIGHCSVETSTERWNQTDKEFGWIWLEVFL